MDICDSRVAFMTENCTYQKNKPKGLKVTKEDQRSIGSMVDRLDGRWSIGSYQISYAVK